MRKNVSGQAVTALLLDSSYAPVTTGTTTVYVTGDGGAQGSGSGTVTHEGNGVWSYVPTQAETNYNQISFLFSNTTPAYAERCVYTDQAADLVAALNDLAAADIRTAVGLASANLDTQLSAIDTDTGTTIPAAIAALNDLDSTAVQSAAAAALTAYDPPTNAELTAGLAALNDLDAAGVRSAVGLSSANLDTQLSAIDTDTGTTIPAAIAALNDFDPAITPVDANLVGLGSYTLETGTAQAGAAGTLTLASGSSSVDDFYKGDGLFLTGGTGAGQFNIIDSYVGSTKVATMVKNWATTPSTDTTYIRIPKGISIVDASNPIAAQIVDVTAAGAAKLFSVDSGTDYASAVAGSVVKEIADNGTGLDAAGVRGAVGLAAANLDTQLSAIDTDTGTTIPAAIAALNDLDSTAVQSAAAAALTAYDPPTNAELTAGLAGLNDLDAAGVRTAVGLASANLDTQLSAIDTDTGTTIPAAIAALNDLSSADVGTAVDTSLATYDAPTKAELDAGLAALNDPTAAAIADAVWEEAITDHSGTAGSTAEALNAAGSAGDPWTTALPGSYTGSQAGKILSDVLADTGTDLPAAIAGLNDPTVADIADAVWEEAIADHSGTSGSTAESLAAAGGSGDPWITSLPGSYTGTQAGKILADVLADTGTDIPAAISGLNDLSSADVGTVVDTSLATYDAPTNAELTAGLAGLNDLDGTAVQAAAAAALTTYDPPTNAELTAGLAGLNDLSSADVGTAVDASLATYDAPTKAELDAGLAGLNDLDAAGVRTAVGLALANLDTQLATISGYLDTEVAAILEDTGTTLPDLIAAVSALATAIKTKTDSLTFTTAGEVDANVQSINDAALTGDGTTGSEWGPA